MDRWKGVYFRFFFTARSSSTVIILRLKARHPPLAACSSAVAERVSWGTRRLQGQWGCRQPEVAMVVLWRRRSSNSKMKLGKPLQPALRLINSLFRRFRCVTPHVKFQVIHGIPCPTIGAARLHPLREGSEKKHMAIESQREMFVPTHSESRLRTSRFLQLPLHRGAIVIVRLRICALSCCH